MVSSLDPQDKDVCAKDDRRLFSTGFYLDDIDGVLKSGFHSLDLHVRRQLKPNKVRTRILKSC